MSFPGHQITSGWGVVRTSPWRFDGLHPSKQQSEDRRCEMPGEQEVYFGDHRLDGEDPWADLRFDD